jgi:hypothetical protein
MGWYILQTVIVFGLMFANLVIHWTDSPLVGFCVSWGAAYAVTKLLSWLFFVWSLLRGIPDRRQAHRDRTRLTRAWTHVGQTNEQALATWVRDHGRKCVEITSRLPLRPKIVGQSRPPARRENSLRRIGKR